MFENRWNENEIQRRLENAGDSQLQQDLVYRVYTSQLIGQVPDLVMHGGGNTSCKSVTSDIFGDAIDVLCVKGSGWDLGTIEAPGLPAVKLAPLLELRSLDALSDEEMVNVQRANLVDSASPNPSVETLLHAFLPHKFVDHTHATPFLALANLPQAGDVMTELFGDRMVFVPYVMPGFQLAKFAAGIQAEAPGTTGMLLAKHGHFTWGDNAKASYDRVIEQTNLVEDWLSQNRVSRVFKGHRIDAAMKSGFIGRLRGALAASGSDWPKMPVFDVIDDEATLAFLERNDLDELAHSGVATPDHVIRIKAHPMLLSKNDIDGDAGGLAERIREFSASYSTYFEEYSQAAEQPKTMLSPLPKVVWAPGVGLIGVGASLKEARTITDLAEQNIRVMADGVANGGFMPVQAQDLFDMEYWSLEQAKIGKSRPPAFQGRVVMVTGGGGAIGEAIAHAFRQRGAEILLVDRDAAALSESAERIGGGVVTIEVDLTQDGIADKVLQKAVDAFGGLDILVSNAGYAPQGAMVDIDEAVLRDSFELNFFAHFRMARAAQAVFAGQGHGGQILFNVSKQAVNPGKNFGAYGLPKATLMFLLRQLSLELGEQGIRVNGVNADRIRSGLLNDDMIKSRAGARALSAEAYMAGNLLKKEVTAAHVADAFVALALSERTTGHVVTVDGGNVEASLR